MAADVRIKRIYDQTSPEDGARLLVDRVWPRGVTKEAARFAEFRRRYLDEIRANAPAVDRIRPYLEGGRTTLLYAAHDPVHNNAVVLADYLRDQAGRQHVRHSA